MERFPLVVPKEPACSNPNCKFLHRQASLIFVKGKGERVKGEIFEVDEAAIDRCYGHGDALVVEHSPVINRCLALSACGWG